VRDAGFFSLLPVAGGRTARDAVPEREVILNDAGETV